MNEDEGVITSPADLADWIADRMIGDHRSLQLDDVTSGMRAVNVVEARFLSGRRFRITVTEEARP